MLQPENDRSPSSLSEITHTAFGILLSSTGLKLSMIDILKETSLFTRMEAKVSRKNYRKSDPLTANFSKSNRMVVNDTGVFYRLRGGDLYGPFESEEEAINDLAVFKKVVQIEALLDTDNVDFFAEEV